MKDPDLLAKRAVWTVAGAATAFFAWPLLAPASAPAGDSGVLLAIASLIKLFMLLMGATFATRVSLGLGRSNPVRRHWSVLAFALWSYSLGQLCLAYYQVIRVVAAPFPSVGDAFFVMGSIGLIVSLIGMVRAYLASGFLPMRKLDLAVTVGGGVLLAAAAAWVLLGPTAALPSALSLAAIVGWLYPITDIVLLVPTVLLLRLAWRMRGGEIWRVWASMVAGFLGFVAGDSAFVFLVVGAARLGPIVQWLFVASYAAVAHAAILQHGLLRQDAGVAATVRG